MSGRHDGKVTISTAIDNSGIEKDLREVNGEFGGLTKTVKETEKAIDKAFSEIGKKKVQLTGFQYDTKEIEKFVNDYASGLNKVEKHSNGMRDAFEEAKRQVEELETQGFWWGDEEYEKAYTALDRIKKDILEAQHFATTPPEPTNPFGVDTIAGKMQEAKNRLDTLKESGKGLGTKEYDEAYAALARLTQEAKEYQKSLTETRVPPGLDTYEGKILSLENTLNDLRNAGKGLGTKEYDEAYAALARLTQEAKEYQKSLTETRVPPGLDTYEGKIFSLENTLNNLRNAGKGLGDPAYDEVYRKLSLAKAEAKKYAAELAQTPEQARRAASATKQIAKNAAKSKKEFGALGKSASVFATRLKSIALGALIFNGISEGLRKLADHLGETMKTNKEFSSELSQLKGALLTAFQPIYNTVAPAVIFLIRILKTAALAVAELLSKITGTTVKTNAETAKGLYEEANALQAVEKGAKKAGKSVAGFDEINKLSDNAAGAGSGDAKTGATFEIDDNVSPVIQGVIEKIKKLFEPLRQIDLSPLQTAFGNLGKEIIAFGTVIGEVLEWCWFNILAPLAEWTIEEAAPASVDALSTAFSGLTATVSVVFNALKGCWDSLQPIFSWIGDTVLVILEDLKEIGQDIAKKWKENEPKIKQVFQNIGTVIEKIWTVIGPILTWLRDGLSQIATDTPINDLQYIIDMFYGLSEVIAGIFNLDLGQIFNGLGALVEAELSRAAESLRTYAKAIGIDTDALDKKIGAWAQGVGEKFSGAWESVKGVWGNVSAWFDENVIQPVKDIFEPIATWFSDLWAGIEQTFSDVFYNIGVIAEGCWQVIQYAWDVASSWFDENVIQPVAGFFEDTWTDISTGAQNAWTSIKEFFRPVADWFDQNIIQPVTGFFTDLWDDFSTKASDAWEDVKETFAGIGQWGKDILNELIRALNSGLTKIFNGVNSGLTKLRDLKVGDMQPFSNIRTITVPQIPYLAQGAVLPPNKPFMAVVGDQKHGTNIEAPLATIQEAVAVVMQDYVASNLAGHEATVAVLREILEAVLGISIGDDVIANAVSRHQARMAVVRGGQV